MNKKKAGVNLNHFIAVAVIIMVLIMAYKGASIDYTVEDENIVISWFTGVAIPIKDVVEVRILDETPKMEKVIGVELFDIRQGTYSLEGIGRVKVYSPDIKRKMVLVKTDKMYYGLTPGDAQEFAKLVSSKVRLVSDGILTQSEP